MHTKKQVGNIIDGCPEISFLLFMFVFVIAQSEIYQDILFRFSQYYLMSDSTALHLDSSQRIKLCFSIRNRKTNFDTRDKINFFSWLFWHWNSVIFIFIYIYCNVTSISKNYTNTLLNATMKCITSARSQEILFSLRQVYVVAQ